MKVIHKVVALLLVSQATCAAAGESVGMSAGGSSRAAAQFEAISSAQNAARARGENPSETSTSCDQTASGWSCSAVTRTTKGSSGYYNPNAEEYTPPPVEHSTVLPGSTTYNIGNRSMTVRPGAN